MNFSDPDVALFTASEFLKEGVKPPFEWSIEYAPDGDIARGVSRVYADATQPYEIVKFLESIGISQANIARLSLAGARHVAVSRSSLVHIVEQAKRFLLRFVSTGEKTTADGTSMSWEIRRSTARIEEEMSRGFLDPHVGSAIVHALDSVRYVITRHAGGGSAPYHAASQSLEESYRGHREDAARLARKLFSPAFVRLRVQSILDAPRKNPTHRRVKRRKR